MLINTNVLAEFDTFLFHKTIIKNKKIEKRALRRKRLHRFLFTPVKYYIGTKFKVFGRR